MKQPNYYNPDKFIGFTADQQSKAIHKLILALELVYTEEAEKQRIIAHLLQLIPMCRQGLTDRVQDFMHDLHPHINPHVLLYKLHSYTVEQVRKDSQMAIRKGDGSICTDPELRHKTQQVSLICDNLRSVFNVGSLFRSAECLGLGEILLCGICPTPDHTNMSKTAMGTETMVPWQHFSSTAEAISSCRNSGKRIYALETVNGASSVFAQACKIPMALVVGNESLGIEPETLALCDEIISLPQLGWKNSLNVGVATAVALYQIIFGEH